MKPIIKKTGSYFLFSLIAAIVIGLALSSAGCCLNLSTWVTSSADTGQQEETATAAGASDSVQASQEAVTDETTTPAAGDSAAQDDLSVKIKEDFDKLIGEAADTPLLFGFLDSNIRDTDTGTITYMVGETIRISEEKKFDFTDKFTKGKIQEEIYKALGDSYEVDMQMLAASADAELKPLIEETIARKYKILAVEGFFMPVVDYAAYGIYAGSIDAELNEFISIYLDESNSPAVMDAGILISPEDFLIRMDKAFRYLEQYPDSPRYSKVRQLNGGRLNVYLGGIDNTPVFDIEGMIYPDRLTEFENFANQYEGTKLGDILKSYLELLSREGFKRTGSVDDFLQKLYG